MNPSDSELNLASLLARISKIEKEQELRRKNITWLKQYFDELKKEFNNRPELEQIQAMQQEILQLNSQVADLQQHLNQSFNLVNSLNDSENSTDVKTLDDAEIVKQFFERVEKQQTQGALIEESAITENLDIAEIENQEEIDVVTEETENSTAFNNSEFQIERIMWIANRLYAAEEDNQDIPVSAEEFWQRYKTGERDFTGINLAGVDLSGKTLSRVNLTQANFKNANLKGISITSGQLDSANFQDVDISNSSLSNCTLNEANFYNANLENIKLNIEEQILVVLI